MICSLEYRVAIPIVHLGWVGFDSGSSPGWWGNSHPVIASSLEEYEIEV